MAQTVTNPGARLAGLFADLGHKLKAGKISEEELVLFLKRRNPFQKAVNGVVKDPAATFVTAEYFTTRPGLWVSDEFMSRITSAYPEALVPRGLEGVESFDLESNLSDQDILSQMGGEVEVRKCAVTPDQIVALIDLQPNGKPGKLLSNGYTNLFYVVGVGGTLFVVDVRWNAGLHEWNVSVCRLGEVGGWGASDRVFRNTRTF